LTSSKHLVCKIMRRFTTEPLTDADLRECYRKLCMSWGKSTSQNPRPLEILNIRLQPLSIFQRIHLSYIELRVAGQRIPERI